MRYFRKVEDKTFAFVLFYILKQIPYEGEFYEEEEKKFGTKIKKLMACGEKDLDLRSEQDLLLKYKFLQIYTDEEMFGLFCPTNQPLYLYTNPTETNKPVVINDINVVGNCTYISDKEVCSTVKFTEEISTNNFFVYFKEFVQKNHAEVTNFAFTFADGTFTLKYKEQTIFEATNINVSVAYSFVLYTLQHLEPLWIETQKSDGKTVVGYNENFKIERIERI